MNSQLQYQDTNGLLVKIPETKTGVAFRRTSRTHRADGSSNKPAASWILDSVGNIILAGSSLVGNSKWGANTSQSSSTNVNVKTNENKTFSFIEIRSLAIAAVLVTVIIALVLIFRKR